MLSIPTTSEYPEYYASYIAKLGTEPLLDQLKNQLPKTIEFLRGLREEDFQFRYAPGKWTLAEVVIHMIDTEMVMLNRALFISRKSPEHLPSMEQDLFVQNSHAKELEPSSLISGFESARQMTLALSKLITPEQFLNSGHVWKYQVSVRALFYIIAGHEQHHLHILKERYMNH